MGLLSQRTVLRTCSIAAMLLFGVACGTEDDSAPVPNTGGSGGGAGAPSDAGRGGGASRVSARLVPGGVVMSSSKYRLVGSMASTNHTTSASKDYELHGGFLSGGH